MSKRTVTVFLPGLDAWAERQQSLSTPLRQLLGNAKCLSHQYSFNQQIWQHFGLLPQAKLPIAAITALFDGLEPARWLRADPVNLKVDLTNIYMHGQVGMRINQQERQLVMEQVNKLLVPHHLKLITPNELRWYILLPTTADIYTHDHCEILGRSIRDFLPSGTHAPVWLQLFTEIQMCLQTLPLNRTHIGVDNLELNALWFFGSGNLPELPDSLAKLTVISDSAFVRGLAKWTQQDNYLLESRQLSKLILGAQEQVLIASGRFLSYGLNFDTTEFDQYFFEALAKCLSQRWVDELIIFTEVNCYRLRSSKLISLWRKLFIN
ncbi:MAG: hypothetical protein K0U12_02230 [Gammaproteobacteria bacterium]|nr:hypothetical protein [Gammaproteobacteria bacterium]